MSFWISRSFDLGDLGVLEKSPVNIFNDYIFEINLFHWSKCTIECAIRLTLISKSAQARCENYRADKNQIFRTLDTSDSLKLGVWKTNCFWFRTMLIIVPWVIKFNLKSLLSAWIFARFLSQTIYLVSHNADHSALGHKSQFKVVTFCLDFCKIFVTDYNVR